MLLPWRQKHLWATCGCQALPCSWMLLRVPPLWEENVICEVKERRGELLALTECSWGLQRSGSFRTTAAGQQLVFVISTLHCCRQKTDTVTLGIPEPSQKNCKGPWIDLLFLFPSFTLLSDQRGKVRLFLLAALCQVQVEEKGSRAVSQKVRGSALSILTAVVLTLGSLPGRRWNDTVEGRAFQSIVGFLFVIFLSHPAPTWVHWFHECLPQQEWCTGSFSYWILLIYERFSLNVWARWCQAEPCGL